MSIGIAILGAGIFAQEAHLPAIATLGSSTVSLKAVYSRSEKSAKGLASAAEATLKLGSSSISVYHDGDPSSNLDTLLARPDVRAVIIVLPITTQPAIILKALAAGKHVISEKPVAPDVKQGATLIAKYLSEYKPKGLIWRVAENYETEPGYLRAGELIGQGKIGKVLFFNSRIVNYIDKGSKWYKTPWRTVPDYQGGFLLDGGVHSVAALRVMLPGQMTHVSSFSSLNKDYLAPTDTINAIVKVADGSHGIYELTFASPAQSLGAGNGLTITGSAGYLTVTQTQAQEKHVFRITLRTVKVDKNGKEIGETEQVIDEPVRGVEEELARFLKAVSGGSDDGAGDPKAALRDVAFIEAALNSEGKAVDLNKLIATGTVV